MCQQHATAVLTPTAHCSYLLKAWHAAQTKQRLTGQLQYLNTCDPCRVSPSLMAHHSWSATEKSGAKTPGCTAQAEVLLRAFAHRAGLLLSIAARTVDAHIKAGKSEAEARDAAGSDLVAVRARISAQLLMRWQAARAHCMYVILHNFVTSLAALPQVARVAGG